MITLVIPWYGPDTTGGAENQARSLVQALHAIGVGVRVWASTGRDAFHPADTDHYPPGEQFLDGVPLWRFRLSAPDERGVPRFFQRQPERLPALQRFAPHELRLLATLPSSDELYERIVVERAETRFLFMPYPFPTSFWGTLLAPTTSYLLPCLHDEPYARYATYRHLFAQTQGMLANSHAEGSLAQRLYGLPTERICVTGEGIDRTAQGDGTRFRANYELGDRPLLLYLGRRDTGKNLPLLLAYVREYVARRGNDLLLLTAGQGTPHVPWTCYDPRLASALSPPHAMPPLRELGFLDQQSKHDACAAATIFVQPSLHESFSIVLMEAWLQGTPALVHAECAVTADHVRRSGGGFSFHDFGEFAVALDQLLSNPQLRQALGARGRAYVHQTCRWADVARKTADFVARAS